jgi:hypothetical protein
MSPELNKKKTEIPQNFRIGLNGEIIKDGKVVEPRPGIKPVPKPPQKSI